MAWLHLNAFVFSVVEFGQILANSDEKMTQQYLELMWR